MGLTRKLSIGFGGVAAILLLVGAITVAFLTLHGDRLRSALHENYNSIVYSDAMQDALDRHHALAQTRLLPGLPLDLAATASLREQFTTIARQQIDNSFLPGERETSLAILHDAETYFERFDALAAADAAHRPALYASDLFPSYEACRTGIGKIRAMNVANLGTVNSRVRTELLTIRDTVGWLIGAGVVLSVFAVYITARNIIRPLKELTNSVHEVEQGNLDAVVQVDHDDEVGRLAAAFNEMAAHLRDYRKLDHDRLVRTQGTTQAAIDALPDAVAVVDPNGLIEISNKTAQHHFGLHPGATLAAVRPDWNLAYIQPVLATRQPVLPEGYRSAVQLFDASGERFLLPRAVPMLEPDGHLIGVAFILVEVTHLHRADEFKSGLLSTVSHELKTPLTSIRMAMRMLLDPRMGALNDRQQTLLSAARTDSERLVRTLEDLLTIDRVEAGRSRLQRVTLQAQEVMDRAFSSVESAASARQITLRTNLPEGPLTLDADLNLMSCALTNLLSNAIKYAPAGSEVLVTCRRANKAVELAVTDQGPGIAPEYQARIFEKFFRVPSATPGPGGVGLGLSIAREILALHEGSIHVDSKLGAGSTFTLRIPQS